MSLRPPSTPSPGPNPSGGVRSSLQPPARGSLGGNNNGSGNHLAPISSARPGGVSSGNRPTSELLGTGSTSFQTPESEALDQWFENLQSYEVTLEEMAAASLDANFKEELSAIEQWFRVLSEAERTAALYSLLQHSTQVQIRFFITVLQQMARSDPMTALLSPALGSSMQSQMEAKLASMGLKSPGLPQSPAVRSFSSGNAANRQSLGNTLDPSSYLSPDSASVTTDKNSDPASTLAQHRAKLKANASHRISAPGTLINDSGRPNSLWTSSSLSQVAERAPSPGSGSDVGSSLSPSPAPGMRPKSTDFTGVANQFVRSPRPAGGSTTNDNAAIQDLDLHMQDMRLQEQLSPMVGGSWASMVNTPMVPMFTEGGGIGNAPTSSAASKAGLDTASMMLNTWSKSNSGNGPVVLDDAKKFRRNSSKAGQPPSTTANANSSASNTNNDTRGNRSNGGWRSPGVSSTRFGGSDVGSDVGSSVFSANSLQPGMGLGMGGLGMGGMGNFGMLNGLNGMAPGMGLGGLPMVDNVAFNQAQLFANGYQSPLLSAGFGSGVIGQPGGPLSANSNRSMRGGNNNSSGKSNKGTSGGSNAGKKDEEDVDPALLNDIPAWLRSLRLHKYTPNFEGMNWKDMVVMTDAALEAKGVAAVGARRKFLKTFEVVRAKMDIEGPEGEAPSSS